MSGLEQRREESVDAFPRNREEEGPAMRIIGKRRKTRKCAEKEEKHIKYKNIRCKKLVTSFADDVK
jgi:hypothetical protein